MKTNASYSTVPAEGSQPYQQFPAQSARIPVSHSQVQLDALQSANGSPRHQHPHSRDHSRPNSSVTSPHLGGMARETSWPIDGFSDLHLSGSEPRIFPGIVSRQRMDSLVRQSSMSETDDHGSVGISMKGQSRSKTMNGTMEETGAQEEESDGDME